LLAVFFFVARDISKGARRAQGRSGHCPMSPDAHPTRHCEEERSDDAAIQPRAQRANNSGFAL